MHFYQFNIADYRKRTQHLTFLEHAIYRSLIDTYYLEESPLTGDKNKLMRSHCVRTKAEKEAFNLVLSEFFILVENKYHHEKCDQELAKIYEKSEKARASAKARWDKTNANASETQCVRNANGMLPITHDPLPNNLSSTEAIASCPHEEIVALYHSKLPSLRKMKIWSEKRKKALRTRWRENTKHQSLDFWEWYFGRVANSPFLMGNINNFQADLEWLVNPTNFIKVIEGKYDE